MGEEEKCYNRFITEISKLIVVDTYSFVFFVLNCTNYSMSNNRVERFH